VRVVRLQQLRIDVALRGERAAARRLDASVPLKEKPATPPHNHLYRNNGNGRFTDVTEKAGLDPDLYAVAVTAADYDNDGHEDLLVTGLREDDSLPQQRGRDVHRCDGEGRNQGGWVGDQLDVAGL
jgi:hypothetical protein